MNSRLPAIAGMQKREKDEEEFFHACKWRIAPREQLGI